MRMKLIGLILSLLIVCPSLAFSETKVDSEANIEVEPKPAGIPLREEVKILRADRRAKMPYLDKGHIKETINPEAIGTRFTFIDKPDKVLGDLIVRAVETSTGAKAGKERITLAKRRIMVATRGLLPEGTLSFELRKGSLSGDPFTGGSYNANFRIPIFRGGVLWNTLLRERADLRLAQKEFETFVQHLSDEVAQAYFEFNRARETYNDKTTLQQKAEKQHSLSKQKFERGLISEIEYLNVESTAGQMQYDLESAKQELELGKLDLERHLDVDDLDSLNIAPLYSTEALVSKADPNKGAPPVVGDPETDLLQKSVSEFIDLAYRHRPELQVEAEKLRQARLEEQISRGSFLPKLDLSMEFGELGESYTRIADDPPHFPEWIIGVELSQNLFGNKFQWSYDKDEKAPSVSQFLQGTGSRTLRRRLEVGILDGLSDYAELKEAQVKKLEQVVELEQKEEEVIREVKEAYYTYNKAKIQVESLLKRNQYRQSLVKLSHLRLEKAEIEISEYLQSEIDLAEERARLHRALADFFKAKSKLNRAIGIRDYLPMEERYGS